MTPVFGEITLKDRQEFRAWDDVGKLAAGAGALIPIAMKRMGIDPALAGSVVLTTITDVVGFFAFLGLATILYASLL